MSVTFDDLQLYFSYIILDGSHNSSALDEAAEAWPSEKPSGSLKVPSGEAWPLDY